jgi:hypothetical protein
VLPFRPDAVVLGFTVFNDAETTVTKVAATKAVAAREQSAAWKTMRWLHDASWAVNFVSDRLRRGRKRSDMAAHVAAEYADAAPGWVECRASLGKFAAACRDAKVPLVVVLFPVHHRDPSLNDWAHYEFRGVHDQVRAALSPWQEAVVVDMTDHLADLSGRRIWIEGNGHPDAEYARRVAAALVDPVARALQLPPR